MIENVLKYKENLIKIYEAQSFQKLNSYSLFRNSGYMLQIDNPYSYVSVDKRGDIKAYFDVSTDYINNNIENIGVFVFSESSAMITWDFIRLIDYLLNTCGFNKIKLYTEYKSKTSEIIRKLMYLTNGREVGYFEDDIKGKDNKYISLVHYEILKKDYRKKDVLQRHA